MNKKLKFEILISVLLITLLTLTAFGQSDVSQTKPSGKTEILWDFREHSNDADERPQEFSTAETDAVMDYLFGKKRAPDLEITTRVTGSFTKPNAKETLYYVGGCDDGEGFKAITNCSHASSWNSGWLAIYDGTTPIRKIKAALGYKVRFVTDVNGDGKEEILSLSGYSGMGETTVRGELGQITNTGYEKIFPPDENFFFGYYELIKFGDGDEPDKCSALATSVSYVPTKTGKFPVFTKEYFKSDVCDSNWSKITKEQFEAELY